MPRRVLNVALKRGERLNEAPFRKIRPTVERGRRPPGQRNKGASPLRLATIATTVVVMHHTVSNVIHSHCCQPAML